MLHELIGVVAALASEVNRSESGYRHIVGCINIDEPHHVFVGVVGFEAGFPANPVGTFLGNSFQRQLVAKLNLKLGTEQVSFSVKARDIEFPSLFVTFFGNEGGGCEDEAQLVNIA